MSVAERQTPGPAQVEARHHRQDSETTTAAASAPRPDRLGLSPQWLRQRFAHAYTPRPGIYWADLALSAALGWGSFLLAGSLAAPGSWLFVVPAVLGLYRMMLFIHEIAHLRPGALPGFERAWNLVAGFPLMVPSLMYGTHADHHKRSVYGTCEDPEYEPIAHWAPLRIAASTLTMAVFPLALPIRWGVMAPISLLVPPFRRLLVERLSTLVINPAYRRRWPSGREARRFRLGEIGCFVYFWVAVAAFASGAIGWHWLLLWYGVASGILVLNHFRTLVAHRYENLGERMDVAGQLLDSVNLKGFPLVTALLAPVGLRYHGLHHLMPALPYHSLGMVHRTLVSELPDASPYRETEAPGLVPALRALFRRAAANQLGHPSQNGER